MTFETFAEAQSLMLWATFALAVVMGAVVNKTNFCTMGAVSDAVNMGDYGRIRAWLLAIAVAVIGVAILESAGLARPGDAFPPYRGGQLLLAEHILGGLMFGIGMTLASGCGNKVLIRLGGGNIKSIFVLAVIALIAYFMVNPFPGTDQTLMSLFFIGWIRPLSVNLGASQDLGAVLGGAEGAATLRLVAAAVIGLGLLGYIFKSADFRRNFDNILGGLMVGLVILGAWYLTSNVAVNAGGEVYNLTAYYDQWDMLAESPEGKPDQGRPLSPQSFTFINPMGQTLGFLSSGLDSALLTFGVMSLLGVIAGSFLWSLLNRRFRIEWFSSLGDFANHIIGALLMGFGGVLAMGCTIGQAITGVSTLALGSFLTFGAIVLGSALTMKIQYYKMVYEDEATFIKALLTSLADLKLLPAALRKLDPV
ncbi:MAG: hypothetical protein A2286_12615 [Gammaproteobacteria bacterium RIFOXYA12_FULL_61_12]|nr:MAG: hypothetical protein A2514_10500 [Gammaproteobacteria bacterium RIFOXYD12_FULL_61_37]OGT93546.1 MAG: hypothetical protein A2286_12615 [Gammaproteobacteria bacterium RIFOXYA12_FULL_61_12]